MPPQDALFSKARLSDALRGQEQKVADAARVIPPERILARSVDEHASALADEWRVDPLQLDWAAMTASTRDVQVDVRYDQTRFITDRSRPFLMPGTEVTYHIPFSGEPDLFKMRPSTYSMNAPRATVQGSELTIVRDMAAPVGEGLKTELDRTVDTIKANVDRVNAEVQAFNDMLFAFATSAVEARRAKVLADQAFMATIGVPLRRREDAIPTYATPKVRRTVRPTPAFGRGPIKPEPSVPAEEYEEILRIIRGMAQVLERSPKAFASADEEAIRTHFLVQLNGQYQGGASGETFNFEGKTDILVRDGEKVVFIAECKFWDGPKLLTATVDQLLGYSSWRDTKTAIFVFNRRKGLSKVLEQIVPTVKAHDNFVRQIPYGGSETEFRFVLRHRDDRERELTLTILVFEVPA